MDASVDRWMDREAKRVSSLRAEMIIAKRSVRDEKAGLSEALREADLRAQAQAFLSGLAASVQKEAHRRISAVVTSCLSAVFGDDAYEFAIEFETKRGRTEAKLLFLRDGLAVDPMKASGGGAVDVAAFALRAACLALHRPRLRMFLALDEPFKFVSREYRPRVREMLETLSRDLGIQIIMVTHDGEYETGKVVEL